MLEYDDWRHILKTDNRPTAVRKGDTENILIDTFGGHSVHAFTTTAPAFSTRSPGEPCKPAVGDPAAARLRRRFRSRISAQHFPRPEAWLRGGFTGGSGDGNPNDKTHGTFFQVLPTPRLYARFPFFNMMNMQDSFGALILRPHPKVTMSSEYHSLRLSNANDLWYSGGGAYQPWTFGYTGRSTSGRRSLANLYDTSVEYRPTERSPDRLSRLHARPGSNGVIYPQGKNAQFGYLEFLYRF